MKLAIMQPYLFPYIGYFQLINAVDRFVIYDNIEYTKKGWINRNRFLQNGTDAYFTIPLKKDSDFKQVGDRYLSDQFYSKEKTKILARFKNSYFKAPFYNQVNQLLEKVFESRKDNLFDFLFDSIKSVCDFLDLNTEFIISSNISVDENLRGKDRVIEICRNLNAQTYINPIGGVNLYDKEEFAKYGIDLYFLETQNVCYPQFDRNFVSNLSIIDVLMFNSKSKTIEFLNENYRLIQN